MDVTTNKLITLCYALLAVVVCTVGYFFYRAQVDQFQPPDVSVAISQGSSRRVNSGSDAVSRRLQMELRRQRQRIDELQTLLRKRESLVQLQESQLKHRHDKNEQLQAEADDYLDLLFEVIQSSALHVDNLARLEDSSGPNESEGPDADALETMRVALEASQWELEQSLASIEETAAAAAAAQARLSLLQQAIVELGDVTVPTLIGLLGDQDVEVRVWSATTLGQLGAAGVSAVDALNVAKDDADASVREAATAALERLSESW